MLFQHRPGRGEYSQQYMATSLGIKMMMNNSVEGLMSIAIVFFNSNTVGEEVE